MWSTHGLECGRMIEGNEIKKELYGPMGFDTKEEFEEMIEIVRKHMSGGWIPVSERLPDIRKRPQRVLATLKNEMVLELWYINYAFKFNDTIKGRDRKSVV